MTTIVPVVLDARPPYFGRDSASASQLLCPAGGAALISELYTAVRAVTTHAPYVLPSFTPDSEYLGLLRARCAAVEGVLEVDEFLTLLGRLDPSDALLLVSPACVPAAGLDLRPLLVQAPGAGGMARHLLAFDASTLRTREVVQNGSDGRVRRIQRYFEPVTWPFPVGVIASFVPVACFQMMNGIPLDSLMALRQALTTRGLPSQDVPYHGECFDLNDERGALSLSETRLLAGDGPAASLPAAGNASSPARQAAPPSVHATARLLGAVAIHAGAVIDANALVVGPSVIGEGARVGEGAVVAQCLVLPGATIEPRTTVRHRVIVPRNTAEPRHARVGQRRHSSAGYRQPTLPASPSRLPSYLQVKYAVEPVLAAVLLVLLMPLLLLLAVIVKATSEGPLFYGDRREGRNGLPFSCWKFRTMLTNANDMQRALKSRQQMDGPQFKMDHDPRITPAGRWLRRLNVDELPQLWNVVRGEMSFVGPRPSPFRENQICVPWRHGRLSVRPGITGLWQVCRHDRALADFHQWIHYDLLYVRNVSPLVDVRIFVYTLVTLGGRRPVAVERVIGAQAATTDTAPVNAVQIAPVIVPRHWRNVPLSQIFRSRAEESGMRMHRSDEADSSLLLSRSSS